MWEVVASVLAEVCKLRVYGPNNVEIAKQSDPTLFFCTLRRSRNKCVGSCTLA